MLRDFSLFSMLSHQSKKNGNITISIIIIIFVLIIIWLGVLQLIRTVAAALCNLTKSLKSASPRLEKWQKLDSQRGLIHIGDDQHLQLRTKDGEMTQFLLWWTLSWDWERRIATDNDEWQWPMMKFKSWLATWLSSHLNWSTFTFEDKRWEDALY